MIKNPVIKYIASQLSKPEGIAGYFSAMLMNISNRNLYKTVFENIDVCCSDTILEIGFGNGRLIHKMAKLDCKRVCGIDISPDMIAVAKKKNRKYILKNKVDLRFGNINDIPFPDNSFNSIYTINTMYFWDEISTSLLEVNRILKKDGIFINAFFSSKRFTNPISSQLQFKQYGIGFLKDKYSECGLEIMDIIENDKYLTVCIVSRKMC